VNVLGESAQLLRTAGGILEASRAQRAAHAHAREMARATRARARRLRSVARSYREKVVAHGWQLWSAGLASEPPTFVPAAWTRPRSLEDALARAESECRSCSKTVEGVKELAVVRALCELTEARIAHRDQEAATLLSLTARMAALGEEEALGGETTADVVRASACRRCAEACRSALLGLYAEGVLGR
jgi:hypothetical protein